MPVPLNSQQVETADDITGSRERRSWSQSPREPWLLGAADMESHSSSSSKRPGTRAGLGPLPMPHGVSQAGVPSKVRALKPSLPISDRWSQPPPHHHHQTTGTLMPLPERLEISSTHQAGLGEQGTLGPEGAVMGHSERNGVSYLQETPGEN